MKTFLRNIPSELRRLSRPSPGKFAKNLKTVMACCLAMTAIVAALDLLFTALFDVVLTLM